jgi:hypothetical protein
MTDSLHLLSSHDLNKDDTPTIDKDIVHKTSENDHHSEEDNPELGETTVFADVVDDLETSNAIIEPSDSTNHRENEHPVDNSIYVTEQDEVDNDDDDFDDFNQANDDNNDDEFDDFNQANDDVDDDEDFGDFDNFTPQKPSPQLNEEDIVRFDELVISNEKLFGQNLSKALGTVFSQIPLKDTWDSTVLLSERSQQVYTEISRIPKLRPPNWVKLKIRHNLLLILGIPINLDDLNDERGRLDHHIELDSKKDENHKKLDLQPEDMDWEGFDIPKVEDLKMSEQQKSQLLLVTNEILSRIETDNMNNSSKSFLENNDERVDEKLEEFQDNYKDLTQLASLWNDKLRELQKDFEMYESVVQSTIGYSQKLKREEIFDDLKKLSKSKQKKKVRLGYN